MSVEEVVRAGAGVSDAVEPAGDGGGVLIPGLAAPAEGEKEVFQTPEEKTATARAQNAPNAPETDLDPGQEQDPNAPPAWTPSLKYSHLEKEHDFDPLFKEFVTNKEREEKLRELYTKAAGLDFVKGKHESLTQSHEAATQQYSQLHDEHSKLKDTVDYLNAMRDNGDHFGFLQTLGYSPEVLKGLARELLQREEMDPATRAQVEAGERYQRQLLQSQRTQSHATQAQQHTQNEIAELKAQVRKSEIDNVLLQPNFASAATEFEKRTGEQGSFVKEVYKRGLIYARQGQEAPSSAELVKEVVKIYGLTSQAAPAPQAPGAAPALKTAARKQSLPSVQGNANSPAAKGFRSIKDIEKERDRVMGATT